MTTTAWAGTADTLGRQARPPVYVTPPPRPIDPASLPLTPAEYECRCGKIHEIDATPENLERCRAIWADHLTDLADRQWRTQPIGTARPPRVDPADLPLLPAKLFCPVEPDTITTVDLSPTGLERLRDQRASRIEDRAWQAYRADPVVQRAAEREALLAQQNEQDRREAAERAAQVDDARDRLCRELILAGMSPPDAYKAACKRFPETP